MPFDPLKELPEVSDKLDGDPTLAAATTVPGAMEANEDGSAKKNYHPVTLADGQSYKRRDDSTLDWKSYKFEMVMPDGTRHDFLFTAKDDADADRKVRERIAATNHQDGTFKLSRLEAPKELDFSTTATEKTVKESKESDKATGQRKDAAEKKTSKAESDAAETKKDK